MDNNKKPKVVFTFVEAGMGHMVPMTGLYEAFSKKYGDKCEVIKSYIFSDSKYESVSNVGKELCQATKLAANNIFYNKFEKFAYYLSPEFTHFVLDAHFGKAVDDFIDELAEINPDMTVATYYLPTHLAALANKRGKTNTLTVTYTPDPYVYPAWDSDCDAFLVNNDAGKEWAIKRGFDESTVKQIPFIYREQILNQNKNKDAAREALGLDKNKFQILVTSGAYGAKKTEKLVQKLITCDLNVEVTIVCGYNNQLKESMEALSQEKKDNVNFNVVGFTDKMAEYMVAADVLIGKSGMNTIMESAYLGTPPIINEAANRLEEIIGDFFVKEGIALREQNPEKIIEIIGNCIEDKDYLKDYRDNFSKYDRVDGAERGADLIFEILKKRFPELEEKVV